MGENGCAGPADVAAAGVFLARVLDGVVSMPRSRDAIQKHQGAREARFEGRKAPEHRSRRVRARGDRARATRQARCTLDPSSHRHRLVQSAPCRRTAGAAEDRAGESEHAAVGGARLWGRAGDPQAADFILTAKPREQASTEARRARCSVEGRALGTRQTRRRRAEPRARQLSRRRSLTGTHLRPAAPALNSASGPLWGRCRGSMSSRGDRHPYPS